ncbi:MAG: SLBB domain-containing protein [Actinobacteria bacterium]|nr:SLBB domain-containing protein [Actinomycetota bacterium]
MTYPELEIIKNAGIVGAGGAGFPTHVKLDARVDTLIVNGAECEPLIHVDKQLLECYFEKVYEGMKIASNLVGAKKVVLALKAKYKNAIDVIETFRNRQDVISDLKFELFRLDNFYPAGDEHVLVYEVTGKVVPESGIPLMVGSVVINVETLLNISNAVHGENVVNKFVTINGEIENPMTLMVPVGTPVKNLIEYCGGVTTGDYAVLDGGPMMGKLIDSNTYAVKKTTKSIVVLPEDNIVIEQKKRSIRKAIKRAQAICLSCRMCTDLCPRYLLGHGLYPDEMMKRFYKGELTDEDLKKFDFAFLCIDCGLCELYSCVVDLSARSIFNFLKSEFAKRGIKNTHSRKDLTPNEFREFRKVPVDRLERRLEIDKYHSKAAISEFNEKVNEVKLYLSQHVGAPAIPVVKTGESVTLGQAIADIPEGKLGAKVHSSIDGTVSEVNDVYISVKRI